MKCCYLWHKFLVFDEMVMYIDSLFAWKGRNDVFYKCLLLCVVLIN